MEKKLVNMPTTPENQEAAKKALEQKKEEFKKQVEEYRNNVIISFGKGVLPVFLRYDAVSKVKSVRRAIRRGKVDLFSGLVYPSRPFNNRKDTAGRDYNKRRKDIYGRLRKVG